MRAAITRAKAACEAAMRELDSAAAEADHVDAVSAFSLRMTSAMLRRYSRQIRTPDALPDRGAPGQALH